LPTAVAIDAFFNLSARTFRIFFSLGAQSQISFVVQVRGKTTLLILLPRSKYVDESM
jgi:hypothetical protein